MNGWVERQGYLAKVLTSLRKIHWDTPLLPLGDIPIGGDNYRHLLTRGPQGRVG